MAELDEEEEPENMLESRNSDNNFMVGFITANIVGLQYYTGSVNGREMVGLLREPLNSYDSNAIRVLNTRGQQVGHIERKVAASLAPFVDQGLIMIEGIVPRGNRNSYKMPCQIYVFSQRDFMGAALECLSEEGLDVVTAADQGFMEAEAVVAKEKIEKKEDVRSVDEIFGAVKGAEKRRTMEPCADVAAKLLQHQKEALAWMVQRENSSQLPPFWEAVRKRGEVVYRNSLTNFETNESPEPLRGGILADDMGLGKTLTLLSLIATNRPGAELPPIADVEVIPEYPVAQNPNSQNPNSQTPESQNPNSENPDTQNSNSQNPDSQNPNSENLNSQNPNSENTDTANPKLGNLKAKGRSFKNPKRKSTITENPSQNPNLGSLRSKRKRESLKKQTHKASASSDNVVMEEIRFDPPDPRGPKTTLVVCPPSVISNWVTQLEEHTKPGSLKVCLYHGDQRIRDAKELSKFDIVLTTYSTLGSELDCLSSPVKEVEWLRVVLDEAHFIKNVGTKMAKAAIALNARRRWAVTGTPIQNDSFDLFSLMAFLHFQPFSIKSYWNRLVQRPLAYDKQSGHARLQALMETIALRRTKNMKVNGQCLVELPPKSVQIHLVELSNEERQLYDRLEEEGRKIVRQYINEGTVLNNYCTILQIILRLRQVCDDSAMCPLDDVELLMSSLKMQDASGNPDLLKKLLSCLQDGDDFECPVCLSPPMEAIITSCSHIFCKKCIEKTLKLNKPRCPLCRRQLTESDLFSTPKTTEDEIKSNKAHGNSSKVSELISLLKQSHNDDPTKKSVIFSQFRKMLDILHEPLKRAGFKIVRLDGSMPSKKRAASITAFASTKPNSPTVLLASLKAAGVGINLTAASDVYMFDPWWNPAAEDQAMDRVHRIGQTRHVRVVRLVVKDSIEESILDMQEKKRKLASCAFSEKSQREQRQMRVEDVQHLMRL